MVVEPFVNMVDFLFNTQKNILVLLMLLGVPLVEPGQTPHQRPANQSDNNRNPPGHDSHPTIPDRFGLDSCFSSLTLLLALAFANCRTMKVLLAMAKAKTDASHMALETHGTSTREHVEGKKVAAFYAID